VKCPTATRKNIPKFGRGGEDATTDVAIFRGGRAINLTQKSGDREEITLPALVREEEEWIKTGAGGIEENPHLEGSPSTIIRF